MRLWLLSLLLLFLAGGARAELWTIAHIGDPQNGTSCVGLPDAWSYFSAGVQWIADAGPTEFQLAVIPGDLVNTVNLGDSCYCQNLATCVAGEKDPITNAFCSVGDPPCNDANAQACVGGTAGTYCEWTRAQTLTGYLSTGNVAWAVVAGNRDQRADYALYNMHFGALSQLSSATSIVDRGIYQLSSTKPVNSYQVIVTPTGARFLNIAISFDALEYMNSSVVAWVQSVMARYDRMPTILTTHTSIDHDCANAAYENAWCGGTVTTAWEGNVIFDTLAQDPQVFLVIGGHIAGRMSAFTSTPSGYPLASIATDYSKYDTGDAPGVPDWAIAANGGGGVVTSIRIDTVTGQINTKAYSPYAASEGIAGGPWVKTGGEEGSELSMNVPMCADRNRFDLPDAACPKVVKVRAVDLGNIRKR